MASRILDLEFSTPRLAAQLDRDGVVRFDNVLSPDWLEAARSASQRYLGSNGAQTITLYRPTDEQHAPAHCLATDWSVESALHGLMQTRCPRGNENGTGMLSVLRIVTGPSPPGTPPWFHYDASVITMLVPILIPDGDAGASGELVIFPNNRPFRRFVITNIVEKVLKQNRYYQRRASRDHSEDNVIRLHPGSVYLFWGYRAFHAPMPTAPNAPRVTLVLHYGNPHGRHPALRGGAFVRDRWRRAFGVRR